jgi:hypothetical protein
MKRIGFAKAALAALAVGAAAALGACETADVSVLQSPNYTIAAGSTYAWKPLSAQETQPGDPRIDNDIFRERMKSVIDANLAAKGLRLVDPSQAQFLVSYHVGLQERTDVEADTFGAGPVCGWRGCIGGFGWGMYGAPLDVRTIHYTEGTVMIDLVDRSSGALAWRAMSEKRVDKQDATPAGLNAIVADMVKSLPGAPPATRTG